MFLMAVKNLKYSEADSSYIGAISDCIFYVS